MSGQPVTPYPQLHELDKLKALLANEPTPLPPGPYERKDEVLKKAVTNDGSVRMGDCPATNILLCQKLIGFI